MTTSPHPIRVRRAGLSDTKYLDEICLHMCRIGKEEDSKLPVKSYQREAPSLSAAGRHAAASMHFDTSFAPPRSTHSDASLPPRPDSDRPAPGQHATAEGVVE